VSDVTTADLVEGRFVQEEHQRLRTGLCAVEETISDAHRLSRPELADRVHRALEWLRRDVLPHAAWEDAWLYPQLDRGAGTPWATRVLRFEHLQIAEVAAQLEVDAQALRERWTIELAFSIVARLSRVDALIAAHVAQEERFVLPILESRPVKAGA
jgi:iron-sulfur cluster repair protein YtfE (RIC family)